MTILRSLSKPFRTIEISFRSCKTGSGSPSKIILPQLSFQIGLISGTLYHSCRTISRCMDLSIRKEDALSKTRLEGKPLSSNKHPYRDKLLCWTINRRLSFSPLPDSTVPTSRLFLGVRMIQMMSRSVWSVTRSIAILSAWSSQSTNYQISNTKCSMETSLSIRASSSINQQPQAPGALNSSPLYQSMTIACRPNSIWEEKVQQRRIRVLQSITLNSRSTIKGSQLRSYL